MKDERGNPVSSFSHAALAHADRALWRMCSFFDAPFRDIDKALVADPAWMFPHVMRASFLLTLTEPGLQADVQAALAQAEARAGEACDRERAHLAAARRCAGGDWHGACAEWEAILVEHPRDLYALQWAHLFDFYRGDARNLRHRVARVLPEWPADDPLRPYLLGMYAFGLEECNLYPQAEAVGREAVAGEAKVPWATHAVAHVMEMQGRYQDGLAWLREREADWSLRNGFAPHHWWHGALFHLESLDVAAALDVYDHHLASDQVAVTLNRLDGASLLWRVQLLGGEVGARWEDVATGWDMSAPCIGHSAFNDVHALLVLMGLQRWPEAEALVAAAQQQAESGRSSNAAMAGEVGLPLMRGLLSLARGDAPAAVDQIAPLRERAHHFGGSHAQRDLIDQTLLAACAAGGGAALGRALINERALAKHVTPLTEHWARRLL